MSEKNTRWSRKAWGDPVVDTPILSLAFTVIACLSAQAVIVLGSAGWVTSKAIKNLLAAFTFTSIEFTALDSSFWGYLLGGIDLALLACVVLGFFFFVLGSKKGTGVNGIGVIVVLAVYFIGPFIALGGQGLMRFTELFILELGFIVLFFCALLLGRKLEQPHLRSVVGKVVAKMGHYEVERLVSLFTGRLEYAEREKMIVAAVNEEFLNAVQSWNKNHEDIIGISNAIKSRKAELAKNPWYKRALVVLLQDPVAFSDPRFSKGLLLDEPSGMRKKILEAVDGSVIAEALLSWLSRQAAPELSAEVEAKMVSLREGERQSEEARKRAAAEAEEARKRREHESAEARARPSAVSAGKMRLRCPACMQTFEINTDPVIELRFAQLDNGAMMGGRGLECPVCHAESSWSAWHELWRKLS